MNMKSKVGKLGMSVAIAATLSISETAMAGMGVSFVGQLTSVNQEITPAPAAAPSASSKLGGGILFEVGAGTAGSIEFGGIYNTRSFTQGTAVYEYPYIEMPLLFKIHLAKVVTVGLGGYAALGVGTVRIGSNTTEYGTGDLKRLDFGLEGALGARLPLAGGTALIAEGRYLMGLQNIDSSPAPGESTKWKGLQFIGGIQLGF